MPRSEATNSIGAPLRVFAWKEASALHIPRTHSVPYVQPRLQIIHELLVHALGCKLGCGGAYTHGKHFSSPSRTEIEDEGEYSRSKDLGK